MGRLGIARLLATAGALVVLMMAANPGWAQSDPPDAGRELQYSDRVDLDEFAPAPEGQGNNVSAPLMVTLAYALIWVLALLFLVSLWRRGRSLERDVQAASDRLAQLDEELAAALREESSE